MFASVVLDIATRALDIPFSYSIPDDLRDQVKIGTTVLVGFSGRKAVGYVIDLMEELPKDINPASIKPIEQVLADAAFDKGLADLALWMAREYAAPLSECLRLMIAPGQQVKVVKNNETGIWELNSKLTKEADDRLVELVDHTFVPVKTASRQREVLDALRLGPVRMAELAAMIKGAGSVVKTLAQKNVVNVVHSRLIRGGQETTLSSAQAKHRLSLTQEQTSALETIQAAQLAPGSVVLVDGVTGSGKTEVYLQAIEAVLAQGKGAVVLVPEISLTAQTVGRFRSRFGNQVAVLHSRLSVGERYDQWDMVRQGSARVVVGARSALFAPLKDPGLIIIDEEHEFSYKQDQSPRYHAREVAAHLAYLRGCPLVLGSATPSFESLYRCQEGGFRDVAWTRVCMKERPGGAVLPQVKIVDMTQQFQQGNHSVFSRPLLDALEEVIEHKQKAVLFLNRRGFSNFLMCRECGCVPQCPHCSTALTYHEHTSTLKCHSCDATWSTVAYPNPMTQCPSCKGRYLAQFGVGTQRVETELQTLIGDRAEIIRMDWDTTRTKGAHQELLEHFDAAECAVLVGTQMIAKGLDFPEVTLVGVINADTTLKLPDFRAAERTYDLLEQVAGRAGRGSTPGKVIVQTYWAGHPAMVAVARHKRELFERYELRERKEAFYPPYSRLSNVLFWGSNEQAVKKYSFTFAEELRKRLDDKEDWVVLGPVDCVRAKVQDKYRRHLLLKSPLSSDPGLLLSQVRHEIGVDKQVRVALDIDCCDMM